MKKYSLGKLLRTVHEDEQGAISLETVLIVGAIALPILIFLIKYGWPAVRGYFTRGLEDLEQERQNAIQPGA